MSETTLGVIPAGVRVDPDDRRTILVPVVITSRKNRPIVDLRLTPETATAMVSELAHALGRAFRSYELAERRRAKAATPAGPAGPDPAMTVTLGTPELRAMLAAIGQTLAGELDGSPSEEEEAEVVATLGELQSRIFDLLDPEGDR